MASSRGPARPKRHRHPILFKITALRSRLKARRWHRGLRRRCGWSPMSSVTFDIDRLWVSAQKER